MKILLLLTFIITIAVTNSSNNQKSNGGINNKPVAKTVPAPAPKEPSTDAKTGCRLPYKQCGGIDYDYKNKATCCVDGYICNPISEYYSQCDPNTPKPAPVPAPKPVAVPAPAPVTPTKPAKSTDSKGCRLAYLQCGGTGYNGPTCCEDGTECYKLSDYWSQCEPIQQIKDMATKPNPKNPPAVSTGNSGNSGDHKNHQTSINGASDTSQNNIIDTKCAAIWGQCGGDSSYKGPRCCDDGLKCNKQSEWYSQCVPPDQVWPTCIPEGRRCDATYWSAPQYKDKELVCCDGSECVNYDGHGGIAWICKKKECAAIWGQCGGDSSYKGPRCCDDGLECNYQSEWYSQCVPLNQVWPNGKSADKK